MVVSIEVGGTPPVFWGGVSPEGMGVGLGGPVRTIVKDGEVWFVANDVGEILGYKNPQEAIREHCKGVSEMLTPTAGGTQKIKIIPERDVYRLIMRSRLPVAERFEEWFVSEVLHSIRKTGSYTAPIVNTAH